MFDKNSKANETEPHQQRKSHPLKTNEKEQKGTK